MYGFPIIINWLKQVPFDPGTLSTDLETLGRSGDIIGYIIGAFGLVITREYWLMRKEIKKLQTKNLRMSTIVSELVGSFNMFNVILENQGVTVPPKFKENIENLTQLKAEIDTEGEDGKFGGIGGRIVDKFMGGNE